MKNKHILFCSQVVFILGSACLSAQDIFVEGVEERRTTSSSYYGSQCTVILSVRNLGENPNQYVRFSELKKAMDSKGNTLVYPERSLGKFESISQSGLRLELMSPAREAATIAELSGTLIFYSPSESNGSVVNVTSFVDKSGENLLPAEAPVSLVYLSEADVKKKAEEMKKMQEEEMAKLDDTTRSMAEGILSIFDGFASWGSDYKTVSFLLDGEIEKFVDLELLDGNGERVEHNGKQTSGDRQITFYLNSDPTSDWMLRVLVQTPKALKTVAFNFRDVRLP